MTKIAKELITKGLTKELIIMYLINEEGIEKNELKSKAQKLVKKVEMPLMYYTKQLKVLEKI